jgi:hypothetical protein
MIDKVSGNVRYAVMSIGGFMGLGHSHYLLPWNAIRYDRAREGYMTNVTEDQLKDAPELSDDSWSDRDWETAGTGISQPSPTGSRVLPRNHITL